MTIQENANWFIKIHDDSWWSMTIHDVCFILVDLENLGDMDHIWNFGKYTQPDIGL